MSGKDYWNRCVFKRRRKRDIELIWLDFQW